MPNERDVAGVARLRRPEDGTDANGVPCLPLAIRSQKLEAWLANLFYEKTGGYISGAKLHQALLVLEGKAMGNCERDAALEDVIEQDPLLAAILSLMKGKGSWAGTATKLYSELYPLVFTYGTTRERHPARPADPARLSTRVRKLAGWLKQAGIEYGYERSATQRIHSFREVDDADSSSSSSSSSSPNSA